MNLQKGLVGHWTMDDADTSDGTLYDRSAYDNHGIINSGVTTGSSGIIDKSFSFDGSISAYIGTDLSYNTTSLSQVTVSAWYNSTSTTQHIIASSDRNEYWRFAVGSDESDGVQWTVSSSDMVSSTSRTAIQDGDWHHLVGVFDTSVTNDHKIYIDGQLDSEADFFTSGIGSGAVSYTHIGTGSEASSQNGSTGPDDVMDGNLDDVRVYNRALSEDEINALYQMRSPRRQTNELDKGLVGHWTMDDADTSGGTLYDSSAYDNHGILNGGIKTNSAGKVRGGYYFDGSDDIIETEQPFNFGTGPFTVSAWVRFESFNNSEYPTVLSTYSGNNGIIVGTANGNWRFWSNGVDLQPEPVSIGEFTHITAVRKSNGIKKLYLDGEFKGSDTDTNNIDNSNNLTIGGRPDVDDRMLMNGFIDDVQVFDRALSESEIDRIYNKRLRAGIPETPLEHNWLHNDGSGVTLDDTGYSSTSLDGSINSATWQTGDGTNNKYLHYDGTNDYTTLPSAAASELSHFIRNGTGTVFCWYRPSQSSIDNNDAVFVSEVNTGSTAAFDFRVGFFGVPTGNGDRVFTLGLSPTANEWQSVGIRADGSTAKAYINGSEVSSDSISNTASRDLVQAPNFGREPAKDKRYYNGDIDRFFVTSQDIGEQELQNWHQETKADYQ
jgi:hypothetical protein